ncbi:hypothetical protein, partial [Candidatus Phytoplasma fabacearum]|uniref:hypothetical protein n=1 Tax=Candidatus Phytoplasma fabacearum TaxID=2982628 RepID=UPI0030E75E14
SIAKVRKKGKIGSTWEISYLNKRETQYEPWNVYSWDKIKKMRIPDTQDITATLKGVEVTLSHAGLSCKQSWTEPCWC